MLRISKIIETTIVARWLVTSCSALLPGDVASSHDMIIQIDGNDLDILRLSDFSRFYFSIFRNFPEEISRQREKLTDHDSRTFPNSNSKRSNLSSGILYARLSQSEQFEPSLMSCLDLYENLNSFHLNRHRIW